MNAHRLDLRLFVLASLGAIVAVFGVQFLMEVVFFSTALAQWPAYAFLVSGVTVSLFVVALATPIIRKRIRDAERTEVRFQNLLESAPDAIVITTRDGRISLVNGQAERLFGFAREEMLGRPVEHLIRSRQRPAQADGQLTDLRTFTTRQGGDAPGHFGRRKDGSEVPLEISFSPLEAQDGFLIISIIRDVTERKRRERRQALRHAVRRVLVEAGSPREAAPRILQVLCEGLGWDLGALW